MPKISILGTATPPPYCDCEMEVPGPHYHYAVFVDPSGPIPETWLSRLSCLHTDDEDDLFLLAAVFDLHGKRLRRRPAIQVSFTAQELPVQIIVAKPGAPEAKVWKRREGLIEAAEKALLNVKNSGRSQDEWVDEVIIAMSNAELIERFNQDDFKRFTKEQLGPPSLPGDEVDADTVKELDYVKFRTLWKDQAEHNFVGLQVER